MKSRIIPFAFTAIGFLIGATALSAMAQTWSGPTQAPPNGNIAAPINVGINPQAKTGLLGLSALQFNPGGNGTTKGYVLEATDALGDAGWVSTSSLGISGGGSGGAMSEGIPHNFFVFSSSGTWTAPAGVTAVDVRMWGGGGGGGGCNGTTAQNGICQGGGGGAAGSYTENTVSVVPGTQYAVTVGAGGAAGKNGSPSTCGGNGGGSSFSSLVLAGGGFGGNGECGNGEGSTGGASAGMAAGFSIAGEGGLGGGFGGWAAAGGSAPMGGNGGYSGSGSGAVAPSSPGGGGYGGSQNNGQPSAGSSGEVVLAW